MGPFVIDTSVAVSWCFEDEASPSTDALLRTAKTTVTEVPALFFYELQSVLRRGERQGRTNPHGISLFWETLLLLEMSIDTIDVMPVQPYLLELGRQHNLSAYDAAYFDLAQRRGIPLATRDKALRVAAQAAGIALLP